MNAVTGERSWLVRARDILRVLRDEDRLPHQRAAQGLEWLEQQLGG
jgi:hypothetical protein